MTTALDDVFDDLAYDMIQEFGKAVTFSETTVDFDPETDSQTDTTTAHKVKISPPERFAQSLVDGTNIRTRDIKFILPKKNTPFTPVRDMKVEIDDKTFTIVDIRNMYSGENVAAYTIQGR